MNHLWLVRTKAPQRRGRSGPPLSSDVRALFDHAHEIPPLSQSVRARALARARAALLAGFDHRAGPAEVRRTRCTTSVAVIGVLSITFGASAYQIRARLAPQATSAPATSTAAPAPRAIAAGPIAGEPAAQAIAHARAPSSRAGVARHERRLLEQARDALAREDYPAAMLPIAEHARRFKDGRLSEEREALRVKVLAGLGRTAEARRAAAAFRTRFPRSVLLPAISQIPVTGGA